MKKKIRNVISTLIIGVSCFFMGVGVSMNVAGRYIDRSLYLHKT